jgi:serine/threonine-protein kinase
LTAPLDQLRTALAGRYAVDRLLGEGGMARVYHAVDERHGRAVAVKVLKPDLGAALGHERFLREIRLAASLQHPHILGLLDSGEADGLLYYVMPYVEGDSLRARLQRERQLPLGEAVRIAREVAEALDVAHARGVVHRDVKPDNILLQGGHALVADFGIARAVHAAGGERLTEAGMAVGTPHYMSPEQSTAGEADARSDQYALGCVLYECLIGQPPFDGPDAAAVLARHAMQPPPSLQVVRSAVPDQLEVLVHRMLAKSPDDRFTAPGALVAELREVEAQLAVERSGVRRGMSRTPRPGAFQPPTAQGKAPAPSLRRVALGVAAGALVLAGGLVAWRMTTEAARPVAASDPASDPRRVAVLYFTDRSGDHSLAPVADGLTEELIAELAAVQELKVVSRNGVSQFRGTDVPRDSVARSLSVGTLVLGEVERADRDTIRVTARLVDAGGTEIRRASFTAPSSDVLAARDALTARVADFLRERLGDEVRLVEQRSSATSTEAWLQLQRAEQSRKAAETALRQGDTVSAGRKFAEADSTARLAADDGRWLEPLVFRGNIAYRRSRLAVADAAVAAPLVVQGTALADSVLARDSTDAAALELRGNLRYWRWLLQLDADPRQADALLADARTDLERAVRLSPRQAGAWGSLSHLYYQTSEMTDVLLAAQRAYEADAYLENAATILDRLFSAAYDLDQPVPAARWCDEGARRFPGDARFAICQLYLMTMRGRTPDVARAWRLATSDVVRDDPSTGAPEYHVRQARMIVAMVLARAGLADSARAVIRSARAGSDVDPTKDLYHDEAYAQLLAGDHKAALTALKTFLAANPEWREGLAEDPGWWFRDLALDPEFRRVVGSAP